MGEVGAEQLSRQCVELAVLHDEASGRGDFSLGANMGSHSIP